MSAGSVSDLEETPGIASGESGGATQEAIEHHYDVGRDFYRLWLDPRMVYSCALWDGPLDDDLEGAQLAKLDWHATSAKLEGATRVLDVGCGWGAMLRHLIEDRGAAHVTGLTLSSDQEEAANGPEGIEVRLEDWRDHSPTEPYDGIVSIGAFEHFARQDLSTEERRAIYSSFFERCAGWLRPGGRLSLQTIANEDFNPSDGPVSSFLSEDIFPESSLPSLADVTVACQPYFRVLALRSDAAQYEHTLHLWQRRLEASKSEALELVGRETYRRYLRYLRVSRAMFDRGVCTLYRLSLERRPLRTTATEVAE